MQNKGNVGQFLLRVLQGLLIGGGAILPGISGGVLCVTFGIYRPMMALLSHPIRSFRSYYRLFIPILIGWLLGFVALAKLVELLFAASATLAMALFAGLIAGTLPSLFRDARSQGAGDASWLGFAICLFALYGYLGYMQYGSGITAITPNLGWYLFCGVLWGLSLVVPGLSSSSLLIFMGLYQPMAAGIAALDMRVILPMFAGIGAVVLLSARLVNYLFEKHHSLISHCIVGVVIASTLIIVPTQFTGLGNALLCIGCFALGFVLAWWMDRYGERAKTRAALQE